MNNFLKKHFTLITILLIVALAVSAWKLPSIAPVIGIAFLCFTLGIAISATVAKHRAAYREGKVSTSSTQRLTRFAFARNVCLDVFGILLAMTIAALLGKYLAELVAQQIDGALLRFAAGMLVGVVIGIGVGILVRQVWGRFVKTSLKAGM